MLTDFERAKCNTAFRLQEWQAEILAEVRNMLAEVQREPRKKPQAYFVPDYGQSAMTVAGS
jgi:hypothetical protein